MRPTAQNIRARRWATAIASLAWMAVIYRLSALPGTAVPGKLGSLAHFGVYAVLGGLYLLSLDPAARSTRAAGWAVAAASAYGITDEFHQLFVPGRKSDPVDWLVDTAGAIFAVLLLVWFARRATARGTRRAQGASGDDSIG